MVQKKSDDLQLLADGAGRPAGTRRLHRKVERGRRDLSEATVNSRAGFEKTAHGGRTPRPHRSMQWGCASAIGVLDVGVVLEEMTDHLGLPTRIPHAARRRPRIAGIVQWRGSATILRVGISSSVEDVSGGRDVQRRGGEVKDRIAGIQPVRNGGDQPIPFDASSHDGGFRINHPFRTADVAVDHCATESFHRC
jgi:hypothetical protein